MERTSTPQHAGTGEPHQLARWSVYCSVGAFLGVPLVGPILVALFGQHMRRLLMLVVVVAPIAGIVLASRFRRAKAEDPTIEGDTWARAGMLIGWVGLAVVAAIVLLTTFTSGAWTNSR